MGAKQSKRSVDIGKEAEGAGDEVVTAAGEGRLEALADADTLKPQLNGDAPHIQTPDEKTEKEKQLDNGTPENEKDATTEKEEKAQEGAKDKDSPVTNGDSEHKTETENGETPAATPEQDSAKKPKKEKVKKKWSLRSISFSRKDKPKQEKKQKEEEAKTNGEPEKVPEEAAEVAEVVEVKEGTENVAENKDEKTPETPVTEPLTNGSSTPETPKVETPASEESTPINVNGKHEEAKVEIEPEQLPVNGLSLEEKHEVPTKVEPQDNKTQEDTPAVPTETAPAPEIPVKTEVCVEKTSQIESPPPPLPTNPPPSSVASFAVTTMAPHLAETTPLETTASSEIIAQSAISQANTEATSPPDQEIAPKLDEISSVPNNIIENIPIEPISTTVVETSPVCDTGKDNIKPEIVEVETKENTVTEELEDSKVVPEQIDTDPKDETLASEVVLEKMAILKCEGNVDTKVTEEQIETVAEIKNNKNEQIDEIGIEKPAEQTITEEQTITDIAENNIESNIVEEPIKGETIAVSPEVSEHKDGVIENIGSENSNTKDNIDMKLSTEVEIESLPPPEPELIANDNFKVNMEIVDIMSNRINGDGDSTLVKDFLGNDCEANDNKITDEIENVTNKTMDVSLKNMAKVECNGNVDIMEERDRKMSISPDESMPPPPEGHGGDSGDSQGTDSASESFPLPPSELCQSPAASPEPLTQESTVAEKILDVPEVIDIPPSTESVLQETTTDVAVAN